jgi:hypothetical protein
MRRVFAWAVGAEGFAIPKDQLAEHHLAVPDTNRRVDLRLPLVAYSRGKRSASFMLVRKGGHQG